jgi:hypothetical protein
MGTKISRETKVLKKKEMGSQGLPFKYKTNGKVFFTDAPFGIFAFLHTLHNADLRCRMRQYLKEQWPILQRGLFSWWLLLVFVVLEAQSYGFIS